MCRPSRALVACTVAVALLCATSTSACSKEEYQAKFGEPYTLAGAPETDAPALSAGRVTGVVTYTTSCATGGSAFTADTIQKEDFPLVAVLVRQPDGSAPCAAEDVLEEPTEWTGRVSAELPSGVATPEYLAFPPDSAFELYILREKQGSFTAAGAVQPAAADDVEAVPEPASHTLAPVNDSDVPAHGGGVLGAGLAGSTSP